MLTISLMSSLPLPVFGGGVFELPTIGAYLGAVLIVALVGSALGVLRSATSPHDVSTRAQSPAPMFPTTDAHRDHAHREAA